MTPQEHLQKAEYYMSVFDKTWNSMVSASGLSTPTTPVDTMVNDNLLRAGELHLRLAQESQCRPGHPGR